MNIRKIPRLALKIGDRGDDVEILQDFLTQFGYVYSPEPKLGYKIDKARAAEEPQPKVFDKNTEKAVILYQEFHQLPATGELDKATLNLMLHPRCGVPDIIEGNVKDYVTTGRWGRTELTYQFGNITRDLEGGLIGDAIVDAFMFWSAVANLSLRGPVRDGDFTILWATGDHGDGSPFDGPGGVMGNVLAHARPPQNGGIHFDDFEVWAVNNSPMTFDFVTVAIHEIGHALGLGHSSDPMAIMFPMYRGTRRQLGADDIAGIRSLYGPSRGWNRFGFRIAADPIIGRNADGRLEVFAKGDDNSLWHVWQGTANGSWSNWASLEGSLSSAGVEGGTVYAIGKNQDGRLEILAYWDDDTIRQVFQTAPNGGWSGWTLFTNSPPPPAFGSRRYYNIRIGQNVDGRLEVFVLANDRSIRHCWQTAPNSGWSSWNRLGSPSIPLKHEFEVAQNRDGRLEVFAVPYNTEEIWNCWQTAPNSGWSEWSSLGGPRQYPLSLGQVGQNQDGRLEVFVTDAGGQIWHCWQTPPNNVWSSWTSRGTPFPNTRFGAPTVGRNADGRLEIFIVGPGDDMSVWHCWQTAPNSGWSNWDSFRWGINVLGQLQVGQNQDGRLEAVLLGQRNTLYNRWQTAPNNGWV